MTQTSELLHSPSLQGRANKSRGKVPVTSFLQPGGGLRRGRQRFPGKHREELQTGLLAAQKDGAQGGELAPHADPGRPLPSIYGSQGSLPGRARLPRGRPKSRGKAATSGARHQPRSPPPCLSAAPPAPQGPAGAAKPERTPDSPQSLTSGPCSGKGTRQPPLTCTLDPGAVLRGAGSRRVGPADSNFVAHWDGAVVTSSPSGRCGPGCDPAASAAARRAQQPPAPPAPRFRAPPRGPQPDLRCSRWQSLAPVPTPRLVEVWSETPCSPLGGIGERGGRGSWGALS